MPDSQGLSRFEFLQGLLVEKGRHSMGGVSDSEGFSRPSSIAGFGASEGEAAAPVPLPGLPCIGGSSAPSAKKSSTRIPTVVPGHVFMHCSVKTVEMCTHAAARPLQRKSRTQKGYVSRR